MSRSRGSLASLVLSVFVLALAASAVPAEEVPDFLLAAEPRARVLLLGTFHFKDAGLDSHKPVHGFDALSEPRQREIAAVLQSLAAFRPTIIAVERRAARQPALDEAYAAYLAGTTELGPNEVYQIGFRLGKRLGLTRLHAIDAPGRSYSPEMTQEQYEVRTAKLLEGVDPARIAAELKWDERYSSLYTWEDRRLDDQTLREHLLMINDPESLSRHHGHYLVGSFKLGRGDDYFGADQGTRWYNRNLRILQNIQRAEAGPEDRILVLIGAGHVPILRHAFQASPEYELIEVSAVLQAAPTPQR